MNSKTRASIACLSIAFVAGSVSAQSDPRYVRFQGVPPSVKGALYMPGAALPAPHVAILVMHRTSNFMHALACTELSKRGFAVLCMNPRSDNNEALVRFENHPARCECRRAIPQEIDYCSTNNSPPCNLPHIRVPLLIAAMGAHYFIRDNEIHYEVAASPDKDFVVVEGAEHGQTPCVPCESAPGQYSNSVLNFYNYVADCGGRLCD